MIIIESNPSKTLGHPTQLLFCMNFLIQLQLIGCTYLFSFLFIYLNLTFYSFNKLVKINPRHTHTKTALILAARKQLIKIQYIYTHLYNELTKYIFNYVL